MNEILATAHSVLSTTPQYAYFASGAVFLMGASRGNTFLMAMSVLVTFLTYVFFG